MMAALRRILVTAFIAALAGLGVITALLGRRPRRVRPARADIGSARAPRRGLGAVLDQARPPTIGSLAANGPSEAGGGYPLSHAAAEAGRGGRFADIAYAQM
jgi:hypothetical protein